MTIAIRPSAEVPWEDLAAVFGRSQCFCQRYKLPRGEAFKHHPPEVRADRLRDQAAEGCGLVAYLDGEPAGWCAVEPRSAYIGLVRVSKVPWEGRDEDRSDSSVWSVTCFLVRAGRRKRGVGRALAAATVDHARERGARAVEGYPMTTGATISSELHPGTVGMFAAAGYREVTRASVRRAVYRLDF